MKQGPRCPVCGSQNIKKEIAGVGQPAAAGEAKKPGEAAAAESDGVHWKCGDCYRKFAKPDEKTI